MKRISALIIALLTVTLFFSSCDTGPKYDVFITVLGNDTLAVEKFTFDEGKMEADVLLRTPTTTRHRYTLHLDDEGRMTRFESTRHDPLADPGAPSIFREEVTVKGDSLIFETSGNGDSETSTVAGHADMLPFIDMVHWPFELMLNRAFVSGKDSISLDLFAGRRALTFVIKKTGPNEMTVRHPYRGTMQVRIDDNGRLTELDAGATTRALNVTRVSSVEMDTLARRFVDHDLSGRPFGPLSKRGRFSGNVHGANVTVDYGQPAKRGRDIFGALVPWNAVWRTGANQATHFTTDRDLVVGGLDVPAGTYTIFTIPAPNGGTLIINRQTGQNGTTYNEEQDLGRVEMQMVALPQTVELFTILASEREDEGLLQLLWDRTAFSVPFNVE